MDSRTRHIFYKRGLVSITIRRVDMRKESCVVCACDSMARALALLKSIWKRDCEAQQMTTIHGVSFEFSHHCHLFLQRRCRYKQSTPLRTDSHCIQVSDIVIVVVWHAFTCVWHWSKSVVSSYHFLRCILRRPPQQQWQSIDRCRVVLHES